MSATPLFVNRLLHVDRYIDYVLDLEISAQEGIHSLIFVSAEDISNDKALTSEHLIIFHIRRLILFVRLAQEFPRLVEEALLISQLVPCLNAENKVESALTTQELSQVHRRRLRVGKRVVVWP